MIDINELRRLAQRKDQMDSLISRLQRPGYDLQKEQAIQEAIVVLQQLNAERDALRAKVEQMEKQEPYSYIYEYANPIDGSPVWRDTPGYWNAQYPRSSKPLYAIPGAQPAPSVPDDVMRDAKRYRFLRAAKSIPISSKAARDPVVYDEAIDAAMLAAAPEASRAP